jgi:hypothetical protein
MTSTVLNGLLVAAIGAWRGDADARLVLTPFAEAAR